MIPDFGDKSLYYTLLPIKMHLTYLWLIWLISCCLFLDQAAAWSPTSSCSLSSYPCDRKTFLHDSTSCLIGATLVGGYLATSTPAAAATVPIKQRDKIYEVPPGSLRDKVILITGASSGLGLESAKRLAVGGATLVLTTRSNEKNQQALQQVQEYLEERQLQHNPNLYALVLDLDDFENSVKSFPERYKKLLNNRPIDILMNNAGVAAIPTREFTKDGFERTFQSNHLGPFLLTALLFPLLHRSSSTAGDARVINVSSYAHQLATLHNKSSQPGLDLDNLNGELSYEPWPTYGRSKLENILFTQELQQRAKTAGLDWLTVVSLHPGVVGTDIWRYTYAAKEMPSDHDSLQRLVSNLFYKSTLTIEQGANTQVWLAAAPIGEIQKGQYYDENRKVKALAPFAQDVAKARELWEKSEQMVGMKFVVE